MDCRCPAGERRALLWILISALYNTVEGYYSYDTGFVI